MPAGDPYLPCDDAARALAAQLLSKARHAALSVTDPITASPGISRIALGCTSDGTILTLVSSLSAHTLALQACPDCAFMVGEPGTKGDPLTHPRLMVQAKAAFIGRDAPNQAAYRMAWLQQHPKAKLYIDLADFQFVRLQPLSSILNAGFGRAYRLLPDDLPK